MTKSASKMPDEKSITTKILGSTYFDQNPHSEIAAVVEDCLVFKPVPGSDFIDMVNLSEFKLSEFKKGELQTEQLSHDKVMAIAPLYKKGIHGGLVCKGLVAVSSNRISVWNDVNALKRGVATKTIENLVYDFKKGRNKLIQSMKVFHIPHTDDIIICFFKFKSSIEIVRINLNTGQLVRKFRENTSFNFNSMSFIAPDSIGYIGYESKSKIRGVRTINTLTGDNEFFPIKNAIGLNSSQDGRFLLVKADCTKKLESKQFDIPADDSYPTDIEYENWKPNYCYNTLTLYQKRLHDLVRISKLPAGTHVDFIPQFLSNGCIIYSPSSEYIISNVLYPDRPEFINFIYSQYQRTTTDIQTLLYIHDPKNSSTNILATTKIDPHDTFFVLSNGDILNFNTTSKNLTLAHDPVLHKKIENEQEVMTKKIDDALISHFVPSGVRSLIKGYMQDNLFPESKLPNRLLKQENEEEMLYKIENLIAKNKKVLADLKCGVPDRNKEYKANRCVECLERFKEIIGPKKLTFKESIEIIWKEYVDIKNHNTGFTGLKSSIIGGSYKEVYDLIESSQDFDISKDRRIKPL